MGEKIFPCGDIADKTAQLQLMGYKVLGSAPAPGMPGFCTLRYQYPAAVPVPAPEPAVAMMASAPVPAPAAASAAPLEPLQKRTAEAIVNIFETCEVRGKYGQVTLIEGDSGHLTFGRSQTTLATGNLGKLIGEYCRRTDAWFASRLRSYLPQLNDKLTELDNDHKLHNLLRASADDPAMCAVQDSFFDKAYWEPAVAQATAQGIASALGIAVVYDSTVHGSWERMRGQTIAQAGHVDAIGEQAWIEAYIQTRAAWLANHERADLRRTVYRMTALKALADHDNWSLELPLVVQGKEISLETLLAPPVDCFDGPKLGSRALAVTTPLARGADVRLLQLALSDADIPIVADGIFGNGSAYAVKQYQAKKGVTPQTGIADLGLLAQIPNYG